MSGAKLARFAHFLPTLQNGLPVPDKYTAETPGSDADLNAYAAVYYGGNANVGAKTIAINLPNDEQVQLKKGTRRLQLENADETDDEERLPFLCECGDRDCVEALMLTAAEFTEAHSAANTFVVKPGHVYPDVERLVAEHGTFGVVEKVNMQPARRPLPST